MRTFAILLALVWPLATLARQSPVQDLKKTLVGRTYFLRGLWQGDDLRFDAEGKPVRSYAVTNPMRSAVTVKKVEMKGNDLIVTARRKGVYYADHSLRSVDLAGDVRLEIDGAGAGDPVHALHAVLAGNVEDLRATTPAYWQPCLTDEDATPVAEPGSADPPKRTPEQIAKTTPPKVLYAAEPEFSRDLLAVGQSASILVNLVVNACGLPVHVHVLHGTGGKMDRLAVAAVQQYRFEPAKEEGIPISVVMDVVVRFTRF